MKKPKKDKIKEKSNVIPYFVTNTITANEPQYGNKVPAPPEENAEFSKECVDSNEK